MLTQGAAEPTNHGLDYHRAISGSHRVTTAMLMLSSSREPELPPLLCGNTLGRLTDQSIPVTGQSPHEPANACTVVFVHSDLLNVS